MSVSLAPEGWHYLRDQQGTLTEELQTTRKQGSRAELRELLLQTQLVTVSALHAAQLRLPAADRWLRGSAGQCRRCLCRSNVLCAVTTENWTPLTVQFAKPNTRRLAWQTPWCTSNVLTILCTYTVPSFSRISRTSHANAQLSLKLQHWEPHGNKHINKQCSSHQTARVWDATDYGKAIKRTSAHPVLKNFLTQTEKQGQNHT